MDKTALKKKKLGQVLILYLHKCIYLQFCLIINMECLTSELDIISDDRNQFTIHSLSQCSQYISNHALVLGVSACNSTFCYSHVFIYHSFAASQSLCSLLVIIINIFDGC